MILFTILTLIIFFTAKQINWVSVWSKKIITKPYNYYVLLGLLVIGFFAKLDYTDRLGCMVGEASIFDYKNILLSSISILLILISFTLKPKILKLSVVIIELVFWIFKLFYFKGGYAVGIGAVPDPIISFYDTLTLAFRLFIISGLLKTEIKIIFIIITTLVIMGIKVLGFPIPLNVFVEEEKSLQRAELTKEKLYGEWIGIYEYDSYMNKTSHILDSVKIRFDTNSIMLYNFGEIDSIQLKVEFNQEFGGVFYTEKDDGLDNHYDFWIKNISSDSLDMTLYRTITNYEFKMTR